MKVVPSVGPEIDLGITEIRPTVGIVDYSRRSTDDFGTTTVVPRGFARRMSVRFALPSDQVSAVQRTLADLRATPARWTASSDFEWLDFDGFYKDFSLDLAVGAKSYCTLTVEGLAETETVPDAGEDPAPAGRASTLLLIQPVAIEGAMLVTSNVPETDYAEWSAVTNYGSGARVILSSTHRVYESATHGNIGNDPAGISGAWVEVRATNRWAMFDEALGTATTRADGITLTLAPGAVTALALIDVTGATVRVQGTGYDQTKAVTPGAITFLDLPGAGGDITVTIAGAGTVSVGTLIAGHLVKLGITAENPSAGIADFSRKVVDDFGEVTIVPRAWAKRTTLSALIARGATDLVANRIASVRSRPSLWIGDDGTDAITIYGFFKDFSIEVDASVSTVALSIEGLSEATPAEPDAPIFPPTSTDLVRPATPPAGTLWIGPDGHPYRFGARRWTSNGIPWTSNGEFWLGSGWEDVQDKAGPNAQTAAEAAASAAEQARQAADTAKAIADAAKTDAESAQSKIATIVADGSLDRSEKPDVVLRYNSLISEQPGIQANAVYYVITTERDAYDDAVDALTAYLGALAPAYDDYGSDTTIDRVVFNATWKAVYDTRQALLDKIAVEAGRSAATMVVASTTFIACDYLGVPKSTDPIVLPNLRKRGNARVDAVSNWTATIPGVLTGAIDNASANSDRGDITITAIASGFDTAEILVTSEYDNLELTDKIILKCVLDAPPPPPPPAGTGATSAQSSANQTNSGNSYLSSGVIIGPVRCGASGQIKLEATLSFDRASNGRNDAFGKWGYATASGGPFTDTPGGEVQSTADVYRGVQFDGGEPIYFAEWGVLRVIETVGSLTPGTDYWFEFRPRKGTTFSGAVGSQNTFSGLKKATQL